eukprot:10904634-Alexandrium_andersonii.AAC.1
MSSWTTACSAARGRAPSAGARRATPILPLACRCDGAHVHKRTGWRTNRGRWPPSAAAEGAYPRDLC